MRFKQQISACLRTTGAVALALCLFTSGRALSASEQNPPATPPGQAPAAQMPIPGSQVQLTADEAVRLAIENNLGIQIARLSPGIQALALSQTRATYAPSLFSNFTKNSNSNPPSNFLAGNDFVTTGGFRSNAGVQQQIKWGGGRYQVSLDGSRNTTSDPTDPFNPRLSSNFNFNFTQPLLRDFNIDSTRQQLLLGQKQAEIVDVQLQQQIAQTSRRVRSSYFDLVGALGQLEVARQSLQLAQEQFKNNQTRVEVGTMAPIDITEAEAEVASREENVIISEARIKTIEDTLRTLIMNPSQPDFWTARIVPSEQPVVTPIALDVDAAVANALANRTDLAQARKELEQTDISMRFVRNQRLPAVNAILNYGLAGVAGTRTLYDLDPISGFPIETGTAQRNFSDALRDIFGNEFKTWSLQLQVSYPIGTSTADAALAQSRLQRQQEMTNLQQLQMGIATQVRDAARQVDTSLRRVEATRKSRELSQRRFEAEQKRMTVGLSTTFQLVQAQRDLATAKQSELTAVIDYNRALVNFEAVQRVPPGQ
jgi:outer membrane protein TolC